MPIQIGLMRIQKALIEDTISTKKAGLLLYSMQLALTNVGQTTFGQAKDEELVQETVDEDEAISENRKPLTTKDTKDTEDGKEIGSSENQHQKQNQKPFTTEGTEDTEKSRSLPLMNADERGCPGERKMVTSEPWPEPVEVKLPPQMYRTDTREGMEAYEASFRLKIAPALAGERTPLQPVIA